MWWPHGLKRGQRARYVGTRDILRGCVGTITKGAWRRRAWCADDDESEKWFAKWRPDDSLGARSLGPIARREGLNIRVSSLEPELHEYEVDWRDEWTLAPLAVT